MKAVVRFFSPTRQDEVHTLGRDVGHTCKWWVGQWLILSEQRDNQAGLAEALETSIAWHTFSWSAEAHRWQCNSQGTHQVQDSHCGGTSGYAAELRMFEPSIVSYAFQANLSRICPISPSASPTLPGTALPSNYITALAKMSPLFALSKPSSTI